jgi:uncharacterized protein YwgA
MSKNWKYSKNAWNYEIGMNGKKYFFTEIFKRSDQNLEIIAKLLKLQNWKNWEVWCLNLNLKIID